MSTRSHRSGFTLLELIVVLAILGLLTAVTGLAIHTEPERMIHSAHDVRLTKLRDSALASGHTITAVDTTEARVTLITAYPDGRMLSSIGDVEQTTGRPRVRH